VLDATEPISRSGMTRMTDGGDKLCIGKLYWTPSYNQ